MSEPKDTDVCYCGHVRDEHKKGDECTVLGCDCDFFEQDPEATEETAT